MVSLILLSIRLKERRLPVRTNRNSCYLVRLTVTANIKIALVVAYKECLIDHFLSCHLKHAVLKFCILIDPLKATLAFNGLSPQVKRMLIVYCESTS